MPISTFPRHDYDEDEYLLKPAELRDTHSEGCVTNASASLRCCTKDGSRPPEVGLQEQASNRPVLLRSKGVVVSDRGKGIGRTVSGEY